LQKNSDGKRKKRKKFGPSPENNLSKIRKRGPFQRKEGAKVFREQERRNKRRREKRIKRIFKSYHQIVTSEEVQQIDRRDLYIVGLRDSEKSTGRMKKNGALRSRKPLHSKPLKGKGGT